ncbi:MGMT family protein [Rhizobium sp. MHM7A]|uniref:methylated-DNA--[protein]-cysteine S-methyltransferase n=1 Tax=Rhizobium sp. MHM7A TaxID=2583233 RepID=UPI001FEDD58C|nr:MGMT family protein [Rhizobium sp. MHM7A]
MPITYHIQKTGQVTYLAKKQDDRWIAIDVRLSTVDALGPLRVGVPLIADLDIHTIDPTGLIEATDATPFQKSVWTAITQIKPGETVSYAVLAAQVGRPRAFRAVANACGANRYAGVIPCHRVVGSDGKLGGYRWGPPTKAILLAAEKLSPR